MYWLLFWVNKTMSSRTIHGTLHNLFIYPVYRWLTDRGKKRRNISTLVTEPWYSKWPIISPPNAMAKLVPVGGGVVKMSRGLTGNGVNTYLIFPEQGTWVPYWGHHDICWLPNKKPLLLMKSCMVTVATFILPLHLRSISQSRGHKER